MKIEFRAVDINTSPRLEGPVIEWVKGLRRRKVARMELYNQTRKKDPLALVVTLVDGSLYLIQRVTGKEASTTRNSPMSTIENTKASNFVSRPIIVATFQPQSQPDLNIVLYVCCSVPNFDKHQSDIGDHSFGLTVLLNTIRHVLRINVSYSAQASTESQSSLSLLWKDAYKLSQNYDYDFWEGSLLERTKSLIKELIYRTAYDILNDRIGATRQDFISTAYSTIARVEVMSVRDNGRPPTSDVAWDDSWVKNTSKLWGVQIGNNTRQLSSQIDGRDLPRKYLLHEILHDLDLVHDGLTGDNWGEITHGPTCIMGGTRTSRTGSQLPLTAEGTRARAVTANGPPPPPPKCDCYVWVSDWQIAAYLGWSDAWSNAFSLGKTMAKMVLRESGPIRAPVTLGQTEPLIPIPSRAHPGLLGLIRFSNWMWSKIAPTSNGERHNHLTATGESYYQELKEIAQLRAKLPDPDESKKLEDRRSRARKAGRKYGEKALDHATQTMDRHGGEKALDHLAQQEWQKISTGSVLRHLSGEGWVAKGWKKGFTKSYGRNWSRSWEDAWFAVWEDAYQSAKSKAIEFGVEAELSMSQRSSDHKTLLDNLMKENSYEGIRQYIEQDKVDDILNHVRLLIQDLSHISSLIAIHNAYSNCVTIRALVPNKDQDLEHVARILPQQPVSREVSYLELRHFIREEFFKKKLRKHRIPFQSGVSHSWRILSTFKLDRVNES